MSGPRMREEVMANMAETVKAANAATGRDVWALAWEMFPQVPEAVRIEVAARLDNEATEAWWNGIERTIDAEIIKKALANGGAG